MFEHYHIPRENLLNRNGDVTANDEYVTPYEDPVKRHGAALTGLSNGRVGITAMGTSYLTKAIVIAIRYGAVRKQFSVNEEEEEMSIIEYQTHQYRLMPHLAVAYALKIFCVYVYTTFFNILQSLETEDNAEVLFGTSMEIHAIASACKPFSGWAARNAIQECREACGAHGYLKAAGIGDLRNDHDANCTYEGENHVLIQQTSNWLLKFWASVLNGETIRTPLDSVGFLNEAMHILNRKFEANTMEEMVKPKNLLGIFQWLVCYLLKSSHEKYKKLLENGQGSDASIKFWAKSNSQVYFAKNLALAYIQHLILQKMYKKICEADNMRIKSVLSKLFSLFGVWCLEEHIPILYKGGYAMGPNLVILIEDTILKLCEELKYEAVALLDVIAPPDFILNSVLGYSDGQIYEYLQDLILQPDALLRPQWWREIVYWRDYFRAKL